MGELPADSVAVLALTTDRGVVLVRQYRPGPDRVLDELPDGGIEPGEAPEEAAAWELREESGYSGRLEIVGSTWLAANVVRRRWGFTDVDLGYLALDHAGLLTPSG